MNQTIKILIVEDDIDISEMIKELLLQNKYEPYTAYSGTEAIMCLERMEYDVVLLDLMLPGMSGEQVLEQIKNSKIGENHIFSVIAISAKDDTLSKINVLRNGADDYITKPFDTEELLARIEVVLRRASKEMPKKHNMLSYKDIQIDRENIQVFVGENIINLTKREYLILELLMSNPNKVFTKNNIYESVWNEEFLGEENAVNVHISNIRQKLAKENPNENYIQTVWGIGFKMV